MRQCSVLILLLCLCVLLIQSAVMISNNHLADTIRAELVGISLPGQSRVVTSSSHVGKLYGNSNGIQLSGIVVVETNEGLMVIDGCFKSRFPDCTIEKYSESALKLLVPIGDENNDQDYIVVSVTVDSESSPGEDLCWSMRNMDLRGY